MGERAKLHVYLSLRFAATMMQPSLLRVMGVNPKSMLLGSLHSDPFISAEGVHKELEAAFERHNRMMDHAFQRSPFRLPRTLPLQEDQSSADTHAKDTTQAKRDSSLTAEGVHKELEAAFERHNRMMDHAFQRLPFRLPRTLPLQEDQSSADTHAKDKAVAKCGPDAFPAHQDVPLASPQPQDFKGLLPFPWDPQPATFPDSFLPLLKGMLRSSPTARSEPSDSVEAPDKLSSESQKSFLFEFSLPQSVPKEAIDVRIDHDRLVVRGEFTLDAAQCGTHEMTGEKATSF